MSTNENKIEQDFNKLTVKENKTKKIQKTVKVVGTFILLCIITGAIEYFTGGAISKFMAGDRSDKFIAVVITKKSDATFTIPEEFRNGFADAGLNIFKAPHSNQNIEFEFYDDFLSVNQASIIADELIENENCVLIIGNSTSELTEVTLNKILSSDKTKPSFLLPIATADNIMDKAKDQNYDAILRMMPNNAEQAKTIKRYIFKNFNTPKVAIFCDEDNRLYSENLSQKIADNIILSNGSVVLKKDYGNSNRFINDYEYLKRYNLLPDVIVFAGISTNGSLLMEELESLKINIPVIFTDGCTVKNLMESVQYNSNYYFMSAVTNPSFETLFPTYEPVGNDANLLTRKIIEQIKGNITRESVSKYISENKNKIIHEKCKAGEYLFNTDGDNTAMNWKVYSYIDGKLKIVFRDDER